MSNRTDSEHQYFARVPTRLLAELTSSDGPGFTFVEADGQLQRQPGRAQRTLR